MVDWESVERTGNMTQTARCVFCGEPSRITLVRTSDGKAVPACRQCVPKRMRLSWTKNPTADALEADRSHPDKQMAKVTQ